MDIVITDILFPIIWYWFLDIDTDIIYPIICPMIWYGDVVIWKTMNAADVRTSKPISPFISTIPQKHPETTVTARVIPVISTYNLNGLVEGKILTGKHHDLHGKITMVSGEDFPLNRSIDNPMYGIDHPIEITTYNL